MNLFGDDKPPEELNDPVNSGAVPLEDTGNALKPPRLMQDCIGHDHAEKLFLDLFNKQQMPHALIFSGLQGIGKATMAYRLAKFLLERGGESDQDSLLGPPEPPQNLDVPPDCRTVSFVHASAHPDMLSIEREYDEGKNRYKDSVDVASIRKVTPFLRKTASEGSYRVVIIDDADTMNTSAQNGLLKILEEPPAKTLIILVAHRIGNLIPTIRSRARVVNFKPLQPEHFAQLLERNGNQLTPLEIDTITALSGGSIGQAMRYIEEGGLDIFDKLLELHSEFLTNRNNWEPVHKLAEDLGKAGQDQRYQLFCEIMNWLYQTLLRVKARAGYLPAFLETDALQTYYAQAPLTRLSDIHDQLQAHFTQVKNANLDKKQGVLGAFSLLSV